MTPSDLLERLAQTLKGELGPNIEGEYPRTQAYLGAVVLQKLAGQLRQETVDAAAALSEAGQLQADLQELLRDQAHPEALTVALSDLSTGGDAALCHLIELLYRERDALGKETFDRLLARVRQNLRQAIDRRMVYAA